LDILIDMRRRRFVLPIALVGALMVLACGGDPPDKEIQQAQGAIDAAKAVGAEQYARDEYTAAQTALKNAADAVEQRDYRLALNHALDARDRAKTAAQQAADRKAAARVDADRALAAAARALTEAQARLTAAESAHAAGRTLAEARRTIAAAERSMQKARASFDGQDYPAVVQAANAAASQLQAVARTLENASTSGPRRRH
jgi:hypothetical protein